MAAHIVYTAQGTGQNKDDDMCIVCPQPVTNDQQSLQCGVCELWIHSPCGEIRS